LFCTVTKAASIQDSSSAQGFVDGSSIDATEQEFQTTGTTKPASQVSAELDTVREDNEDKNHWEEQEDEDFWNEVEKANESNKSKIENPYAVTKPRAISNGSYELIKNLDPSMSKLPWVIEATVKEKSNIITYNNDTGGGIFFYAILSDKSEDTIKALFYNSAAEKFKSLLCQGSRYTFCRGYVKPADPTYNNDSNSNFVVIFDLQSTIEPIKDAMKRKMFSKCLVSNKKAVTLEDHMFDNIMDRTTIAKLWLSEKPDCTIFARIFRKRELKEWSSEWSHGIHLSVDLIDSSGVDITANFPLTEAAKFSQQLQEGKSYVFLGFEVKAANIMNKKTVSDFEILITDKTHISDGPSNPDTSNLLYNYLSTKEIEATQFKIFDVRGVVLNFTEPSHIAMRNQEHATRCDITLVDDTGGKPIIVTVWDKDVVRVQKYCNNNPVVRICPVRVSQFNNECTFTAIGQFYPADHSVEGKNLQQWWHTTGKGKSMW
jgi:hypothetical protein